ncbi:MAG: hypothetical protein KJP09_02300 [Bacteroidia bacterium]|nr:hypothetical protein [Bacteroidia bacterium]NND10249.1 hypothetical protein [Flavobacteriaceae bacterium]MBT8310336.1 hypothetical protein [Bacteroidia bacterium]NNK29005.1 hypothetical protein [Flavobacteriaceae bacterium]NNL60352.1 hypothetical protein [Flavobacteriaceae bacterium]
MALGLANASKGLGVIAQVVGLVEKALTKRGTRIDKKIDAVKAMQKAVNNTRLYLVKSKNKYEPNAELSNLWNDAFAAMVPIDKSLARQLNNSSRFWSDPHRWLAEEGAMELIPDLEELDEKCDSIIVELENRK